MALFEALLPFDSQRFNAMTETGTPVTVTYSFKTARELGPREAEATPALREAVKRAAAELERTAGIEMVEVNSRADAMIDIAIEVGPRTVSFAYFPFVTRGRANTQGDLIMADDFVDYRPGSQGYEFLLHEFGHAVGLDHPFEGPRILPTRFDNTNNTVMSYTERGAWKDEYQRLDVQALQHLYGSPAELRDFRAVYDAPANMMRIDGNASSQVLIATNDRSLISGRAGDDSLWGRDANDTLRGQSGDDVLEGLGGNDRLEAGSGDDTLVGFNGVDYLDGDRGEDRLLGGRENDRLFGGNDDDVLFGNNGHDMLRGEHGSDRMLGGAGNDRLTGGRGHDTLRGDGGDDSLWGGAGNDALFGGSGADMIRGQEGQDRIIGGAGADTIDGGPGNDRISGGSGADVFILRGNGNNDVIVDFDYREGDRPDVSSFSLSKAGAAARLSPFGADDMVFEIGNLSVRIVDGANQPSMADWFIV